MRLNRRQLMTTLTAFAALPAATQAADAPLSVTATTGMIADTARNVAGDLAQVQALMGPGVDPHSYRQTRTDIVTLSRSDLILRNGHYLEAQLVELFDKLSSQRPITAVAEAVPTDDVIYNTIYEGRPDPHIWMVPALWTHAITATRDAIIDLRPEAADQLRANAEAYIAEAQAAESYARETLATVPEQSRVLVTAHDAFAYFGRAYGFDVLGIQGISTESEAGLARIRELVDTLVNREISAVFVESSVSDRNVRALIEGAAARGHRVQIGGELYSDAMGQPGTYEGTWLGMVDHNATTITRALGGEAPASGRLGKLSAGL
ncbi:metal ABC transporter solute-binding protein, Zn/Mn family [Sagittula sp. SSi028]|uniref:metal ABC transporter solute-binding protein, Zn/Mn family n=1 Tax=Sagittula sp. SSi028 TaxID=3400636 RepID=UPI003AF5EDDE